MHQGGQYGDVPPQYARPSGGASTAASGTPNPHAHLFNLAHDVAAAGGGLGLSSNSPSSLSHSGGHLHHAAHSFSLHHHPLQGSVPAQPYHHFPDHLSSHHHHQQSIQSAPSPHTNPQQPQLEHSAPAPSSSNSPAGLHSIHQQSQKHGMVPSVTINAHAEQETPQLQQSSILQQQYTQQQQHSLGLGLDSPKPSLSSLQQALAGKSSAQQPQASSAITNMITSTGASSTPISNIIASSSPSMMPSSMAMQGASAAAAAAATMINSSMAAMEPGVAMNLQQLTNNRGLQAGTIADQAGLQDEADGLGDEGDKGSGGNRWPRQETLALLKVRSEMDASFRDSSLKRPLWDEVSRKLAELGFQRSAKKCKEKFENVHKYYKRTKEGRAGRQDGKNYRFFSELEALYSNAVINQARADSGRPPTSFLLGSSLGEPTRTPDLSARPVNPASFNLRPLTTDASGLDLSSDTSSSDDDNDDEYETPPDAPSDSKKRKRKSVSRMMSFFESLLKQVIEKQEQMQQRFLDALERREQDRMIREEAWKRQEMARMSREHDLRSQERSLAATRDAAIVAFLQKVTGQTFQLPTTNIVAIAAQPVQSHAPPAMSLHPALDPTYHHIPEDQDPFDPNSKRWPKPEVLALIKLRTGLHSRFTEPGPKGPLWEDIANGMSRLGYNRNAKRCKEKWENINKYFKKAKESNKNRPENAKTCPYYHQLDALYKQGVLGSGNVGNNIKALTYKPSADNLDGNHIPAQLGHASARSGREGDLVAGHGAADQVLAIMPPTSQMSSASDATASTGNANVLANAGGVATHLFSAAGNPEGGDLISKEMKPHPGNNDISLMRPVDVKSEVIKAVIENPAPRLELSDDMSMRPRLQMQRGIDEAQLHAGNASNQGYEHKVDLEQEAGELVNEGHEAGHQQKQHVLLQQQHAHQAAAQLQYQQMEGVASGLAQHSSFIANMLQKFSSSDPAESNTSTASTNQDQH